MFSKNISKEQQAELAVISELIARNEADLELAVEPSTYVVIMETQAPQIDAAKAAKET